MRVYLPVIVVASFLFAACPASQKPLVNNQSSSQPAPLVAEDIEYENSIKTVQLYRGNDELAYPVIYLQDETPITLEFDEWLATTERQSDFFVDIVNCDANWKPTYVLPIQFYEGFTQDRIDNFQRSDFTKVPYVHYRYQFPQRNEFFKMSGNYLLKVFRNNDKNQLVFTRRFIVVDQRIVVRNANILNDQVQRQRMEDLSFEVLPQGLGMLDPLRDMKIVMLQNFRWDNAIQLDRPWRFGQNSYEYRVDLTKEFLGGSEFRWHDVRSTRFYSASMKEVEEYDTEYVVSLFADKERSFNTFSTLRDRNGAFYVEVQEWEDFDIHADYVLNQFKFIPNSIPSGDIYILGAFNSWRQNPSFKMEYNPDLNRYEADVWLKQGVYDYVYAVDRGEGVLLDDGILEGGGEEGENYYTVIIYFKAPTEQSHQIVGYLPINYYD